jgi:hypothetical protein
MGGGHTRTRTWDPLIKSQLLYQLSYPPGPWRRPAHAGVVYQVNVPGTVEQHPNWRRRWPLPLEQLVNDQRLRRIAAALARAGRGSAPAP